MIKKFKKTIEKELNCFITFPPKNENNKPFPTILFLHGAGERGNNLNLIKKKGIPKVVLENPDFPFLTISPQCPENEWWNDKFEILKDVLFETVEEYNGDKKRIYLTGFSMGGCGSWHLAAEYFDVFAAVVPICGGVFPLLGFPHKFKKLVNTPIWAFHGEKDDVVPIEESEKIVNFLKKENGKVKFTKYPNLKHDSWTITYDNPELYNWLLKQHL
jgi:predicted peptidase